MNRERVLRSFVASAVALGDQAADLCMDLLPEADQAETFIRLWAGWPAEAA